MTLAVVNVFSAFICLMEMYINSCVHGTFSSSIPLNTISNEYRSGRTSRSVINALKTEWKIRDGLI